MQMTGRLALGGLYVPLISGDGHFRDLDSGTRSGTSHARYLHAELGTGVKGSLEMEYHVEGVEVRYGLLRGDLSNRAGDTFR